MDYSEKIRKLCARNGIAVSKLEQECGFGNGYISKLKDKIPSNRLQRIANFFNIPIEFLLNEIDPLCDPEPDEDDKPYMDEQTAEIVLALENNPELKLLFDQAKDSTPEDINVIYQVLLALKRKERLLRYADSIKAANSREDK